MHNYRNPFVVSLLGLAIAHSISFAQPSVPATAGPLSDEWTAFDAAPLHWFGYSVATEEGWRLAGAPMENRFASQAGAAYLLDTTVPGGVMSKVLPSERIAGARFGWSVDVSERYMVVGAPGQGALFGEAFVFERSGEHWVQAARLSGIPGHAGDGFGYAVAIHGDRILVGAPFDNAMGVQSGAVYSFKRGKLLWVLEDTLRSPRPFVGDQFGFCLDVDGDRAVVGAWSANIQVYNEGAAFVFEHNGSGYALEAEIVAPNPRPNAMFARSVAIQGDRLAVGATEDHPSDMRSGSVSLYVRKGTDWHFEDQVQAPGKDIGNAFGYSVALLADSLLVGAPLAMRETERSGDAFIFHPIGPRWGMAKALVPKFTPGVGDYIGVSVRHASDGAMVGAMRNSAKGYQAGAVHLYAPEEFDVPLIAAYCDCGDGGPCGAEPQAHGCENSTGHGARLQAFGGTSIGKDDLMLVASDLPSRARTSFVVGAPRDPIVWHDGLLCISTGRNEFAALESRKADQQGMAYTRKSLLRLMDQAGLALLAGSSWAFQATYYDRNGPCGRRYNTTDALLITLVP